MNKVKKSLNNLFLMPGAFWLTVFLVIPSVIIFGCSFLSSGLYGGVTKKISFLGYKELFSPNILIIFLNTFYISIIVTIFTVLLGLPVAYYIANSRKKTFLLLLVVVPFWVSILIKLYAWMILLNGNGLLNSFLIKFHIINSSIQFLYNRNAIIFISIYSYLPYAILPLFVNFEKFDFTLEEAAKDLGANKFQCFFKVVLPNIKSGIFAASIFVFIPTMGSYIIPELIGGKSSLMIGNVICNSMTVTRDWPMGAAFSLILTILTLFLILVLIKSDKKPNTKGRKK